jgi:uncharacterized protein YjbJ (UPF0337 family)
MKQDTTDVQWNRFLDRVKDRWEKLTNDDLDRLAGRDELLGVVQQRYGVTKEEALQQVRAFENAYGSG